jgi:ribosome-binding protein aMBF1 (putative translation factor)
MAKYSTGSGGGDDGGGSCELCGKESSDLRQANVAGADLLVCGDCAPHGENRHAERNRERGQTSRDRDEPSRSKRAAQSAARVFDASRSDSSHWEKQGTHYESDRLPYLVSNYGPRVESARQEAGYQLTELAAELDIDEDDLLAVEQGRASRANVGGSVIRKLEEALDVTLADE